MSSGSELEWTICGICGARIKRKNLAAHFSRAHPGSALKERRLVGPRMAIPYWLKLSSSLCILGNFLFFLVWPGWEHSGIISGILALIGSPLRLELIAGLLLILISGSYMAGLIICQRLGLNNLQAAGLGTLIWMGVLLIPAIPNWWFEFCMVSLVCLCLSYLMLGYK